MPGNEIPENIHNFFEQENSSQSHQSQGGGRNWPNLNNNPWAGTQMQNGQPPTFTSKNNASQSLDSERGIGMQSIQTTFVTNPTQSFLKPELIRRQPRNQQLNLNGYMHGSQDLQLRPIQAQFQGDGTISDSNQDLLHRGFNSFEPLHNAPVYNSGLTRNSELPDTTEAPVSFDFLGSQQLTRNRHPGLAQPRPRELQGMNEMQLWQQQLMYKRLQEMQQQQQLQQLQQRGRYHNSVSQLSGIAGQETSDRLPTLLSGMPINDASNFMQSNELIGGELKLPASSHMLFSGNMNWTQNSGSSTQGISNGLMFPHDKGQAIQSMGFVPQQPDQSLYGTPVASTRGSLSHPLQFQGMAHDFTSIDMSTKAGANLAEKALMQASAFNYVQSDQYAVPGQYLRDGISLTKQRGKNMFENGSTQSESGGATSGSFQQVDHFSPSMQAQEVEQVGPSQVVACLDPTEEKLLFSGDDDGNQDASFRGSDHSTGGYHQNPSQSNDYLSAFPSINSGSWSALMQEAVEASSSDTGVNEEWSGLSFPKTELSSRHHSTVVNANNMKQQAHWSDGNHQSASPLTSTAFPLFKDAEGRPNCHATPSFQPNNFSHQQSEGAPAVGLDQQNHSAEGSLPLQSQFCNTSNGVWPGREQPARAAHLAELNLQNMERSWVQQCKVPLQTASDLPLNKLNGWHVEASAPTGRNHSKTNDNDDRRQHSMNMDRERESSMWMFGGNRVATTNPNSAGRQETVKSDIGSPVTQNEASYIGNLAAIVNSNNLKLNQETDQQLLSRQQPDYGKHVAADTFLKSKIDENVAKYQNQPSSRPQACGLSMDYTGRTSSEIHINKQKDVHPNEGFNSRHLMHMERGGSAGENSLLARNDPHPLVTSNPKSGQDGRENLGSWRFQFHPVKNLEMSKEPVDSQNHSSFLKSSSQLGVIGLKDQDQEYAGRTQFTGHVSNNAVDMRKGHFTDLQINAKAAEERQSGSSFSNQCSIPSFDGSTSQFLQNKRSGLTSENMLELLHKVDQSRVENTVADFDFSERNTLSEMPDVDVSGGSASHFQHNQLSALQGVGLKLAPPSQRQSVSDRPLPSQASSHTAHGVDQRNSDSGVNEKVQTWSLSPSPVQSPLSSHGASQRDKVADKSFISDHRSREAMNSSSQGNLPAAANYTLRMNQYRMHQQQQQEQQQHQQQQQRQWQQQQQQQQRQQQQQWQQHAASATGPTLDNQPTSDPFVNKVDAAPRQPFHAGKGQGSHIGTTGHSAETSLPSGTGRIPPTGFTPDTCRSVASQLYPVCSDRSEPTMPSSLRSLGQQNPAGETRSAGQPSATSAISEQAGFSKMLHNVWTSVSSQRKGSGLQPQKIISNVLRSMNPLPCSTETSSQTSQKADNLSQRKGEIAPYRHGDHLVKDTSSQQMPPPEMVNIDNKEENAPKGEQPDPKHHSDGPSAVFLPSSVRLYHQQDLSMGKHTQDSSLDTHKGYVSRASLPTSNRSAGPHGHSQEPSEVQKQNYSLLQQMQAMEGADSDPSKRSGKRLKGADSCSESSQKDWVAGHRYVYPQSTALRDMNASSQNITFPSDVRMLSFSSKENEGNSANTSLQDPDEEASSQDQVTNKHHLHNHAHPHGRSSPLAFVGGSNRPQISPQMAPSWFEQYGNLKNGHILTTNSGVNSSQSAKAAAQHHFFSKFPESMNQSIVAEQKCQSSKVLQRDTSPTTVAVNPYFLASPPRPPLEVICNDMVLLPKKRKSPTEDLLAWHKVVTEGCQRLQSMSIIESGWAAATNRLTEKVEDEHGRLEDGSPIARSRNRLILTSQLMQQIFPSIPARFLIADVTTSYESVTFFCAKLTLGDACRLASCSGGHSHTDFNSDSMGSGKLTTSEMEKDNLSNSAEDFIRRSRKLENDLLRLDSRASLLDVRLECQELERASIINRFAKFRGRAQIEGIEGSSASEIAPRHTYPQRLVTALALPTNLPEGVTCLSL